MRLPDPLPDPRESGQPLSDLARYSGLGLSFAVTLLVFAAGGWWLDRKLGSSPWLLIVGVFAGFGLSLYSMLQKLPSGKRDGDTEARAGDTNDSRSTKSR